MEIEEIYTSDFRLNIDLITGEPEMRDTMIIAFDSTQQALRAEMLLEYADLEIDICPTPKEITAGCALSISFERLDLSQVRGIIRDENVEIRGIYRKDEQEHYILVVEEDAS